MEKGANRDVTGISDGERCWRDRVTIALLLPGLHQITNQEKTSKYIYKSSTRHQITRSENTSKYILKSDFLRFPVCTSHQNTNQKTPAPDTFSKVQKWLAAALRLDIRIQIRKTAADIYTRLQSVREPRRDHQSPCTKVQKKATCSSANSVVGSMIKQLSNFARTRRK